MKDDLASLFRWHTTIDIKNKNKSTAATLYIKLVGDVDYSNAQQYGLLASRKLRKLLADKDSIEYQSLFFDVESRTKEELIPHILLVEIGNFREEALADLGEDIFNIPAPEISDNPTLEEREKQQEYKEQQAEERTKKLRDKIEEKSNDRKAELEKKNISELREIFFSSSINYRCIEEFSTVFRDFCMFSGTYKDADFKKRAFASFDEFRNASPSLKRQISEAYQQLEITGEQLKN